MSAALAVGIFAGPQLFLYYVDASLLIMANEPVSYRYFLAMRVAAGEGGDLWLPQGQSASLLYRLAYEMVALVTPATELFHRIDGVGFLYGVLVVVTFAILMLAVVRSRLSEIEVLLVGAIPPAIAFLLTSGFTYAVVADYQHLNMVLFAAGAALFMYFKLPGNADMARRCVLLGLLAGACAANKLSMVAICLPAASLLAYDIIERGPWRSWRKPVALSAGCAFAAFALVFVALYSFSPIEAVRAVINVLRYARYPGTHEPAFLSHFGRWVMSEHYGVATAAMLASAAFVFISSTNVRRRVAVGAFLVTGALYALAIIHRPATSTGFDAACSSIALTAMALSLVPDGVALRRSLIALILGALAVGWATFEPKYAASIASTRAREAVRLQAWAYAVEGGAPIVAIVPDNSWGVNGGPIITLVKGLSEFPGWTMAGRHSSYVQPPFTFRSEQGNGSPAAPYSDDVTLMWEDFPGRPQLASLYPELAKAIASRHCKTWSETGVLFVCPPRALH